MPVPIGSSRVRAGRISIVLGAAMMVLVGCAIPEVPYDRESAGKIHRVGIVTPGFPTGADVWLATSPGQSFGLIGALVDAGIRADQESRFDKLLHQQNLLPADFFEQSIAAGLQARGYDVATIRIKRDKAEFAAAYPTDMQPSVDAYLDLVVLHYGYAAAGVGGGTPWRPWFVLRVRLVRASDLALLMQDTVVYNPVVGSPDKTVTI